MSWPLPQDFNEAVQNPASSFADPDLAGGQTVVGPTGLPLPRSGNFADVYQVRAADNRDWALKCFTRPVTGLGERYKKLEDALKKASLPFTIGFAFLREGVMVHGAWRPAVKMEWVDGLQLNQAVRVQAGSPKVLDALGMMWSRLCKKLREAGIAHADLQHGNVLLVAGSKVGSYSLKLIDYDGMYTPALANTPSGESGHPNYQHPHRATKQVYSPDLDRFPHLVIATALKGLAVLGAKLWEKYDTGDNLLFTEDDFKAPASSPLMKELWQSNDPALQALAGHLAVACAKPIPQTPWLDQVSPDGAPIPLTPDQARNAATALGVPPPPSAAVVPVSAGEYGVELVSVPPPPAPSNAFAGLDDAPSFAGLAPVRRRRDEEEEYDDEPRRAKPKSMAVPLAIGGGVLALVIAVVAGIMMSGDKKPDETAQNKQDDDKEKPKPPIKDPPKPPDVTPPKKDPITPPVEPPTATEFNFDPASAPELNRRWESLTTGVSAGAKFTSDGEYVIAKDLSDTTAVRVYAASTGTKLAGFTEGDSALVDFACLADGNVVSWHVNQPFAIIWNPATGKGVRKIPVRSPAFAPGPKIFDASPDGGYIVVGHGAPPNPKPDESGQISLYDSETGKEVLTASVLAPKFRFTEKEFIIADVEQLQVYKLPSGRPGRAAKFTNLSRSSKMLACTPDGGLVLHPGKGRDAHVIDCKTGKIVTVFPNRFTSTNATMSDDGRLVAICSPADRQKGEPLSHIEVMDLTAKKLVGRFILANGAVDVASMSFAPDNSAMVVTRAGRRIQVIEVGKGTAVAVVPKKKDPDPMPEPMPKAGEGYKLRWSKDAPIRTVVHWFAADGKSVFLAQFGNFPKLESYDLASGELVAEYKGLLGGPPLKHVSKLDDGRVFAVTDNGTPLMWDFKTGREIAEPFKAEWLPAEKEGSKAFHLISPNGKHAFTGRYGKAKPAEAGRKTEFELAPYKLVSTDTGMTLFAADWGGGTAMFSADSKWFVLYDVRGFFRRINLTTKLTENTWTTQKSAAREDSFHSLSADSSALLFLGALTDAQEGYHVVDVGTGKSLGVPRNIFAGRGVLSADGKQLGFASSRGNTAFTVQVIDVETGKTLREAKFDGDPNLTSSLHFAPDLMTFGYTDEKSKKAAVYDFHDGSVAVVPKKKDPDPMPPDPMPKPKDPPKIERVPVPDADALAKAEAKLHGLLKDDYAKKLPSARTALAQKLIGLADDAATDSPQRYVMLRDARDFAIEVFDTPLAMQALDGILRWYVVDADAIRLATFDKIKETAGNNSTLRSVAELALAASDIAMAADNYPYAMKYAQTAADAVKRGSLPVPSRDEVDTQIAKATKGAELYKPVQDALDKLKSKADDTDAAFIVGRYRCFFQGRWAEGLKHLAAGATGDLKAAAELDLAAPKAGPVDVKIAEAWWQAAQTAADLEKAATMYRARHWYARALASLMGDARTQAESRLGFTLGGTDYRSGLIAEFTAKVPAIFQGKKARVDSGIDFNAGEFKAEGAGVATDLKVTWTGSLLPQRSGRYHFTATATDPVIVRIDDRAVIDTNVKGARRDATVVLPDRPVSFSVEFKSINTEKHSVKLLWSIPGMDGDEPIPPEAFWHDKKAENVLK